MGASGTAADHPVQESGALDVPATVSGAPHAQQASVGVLDGSPAGGGATDGSAGGGVPDGSPVEGGVADGPAAGGGVTDGPAASVGVLDGTASRTALPSPAVTDQRPQPGETAGTESAWHDRAGSDAPRSPGSRPVPQPDLSAPAATGLGRPGSEVVGAHFAEIPISQISPNPRQPRQAFDEEPLNELVQSIQEVGLLQPIVVRQLAPERFELVMGERRWRAVELAGWDRIPAIVRSTEDDKLLLDALLENLHRTQLNPLEEAAAYDQLLQDFSCTHEALADRIGRSRSQVSNTLRLLKLPPTVQRKVAAGVLSAGHARALLALESAADQERLAGRIVAEGLSVRTVEELVTVGDADRHTARRPRAGRRISPALDDLAARLSDRWETRVKVQLGQKRGRIVVEFASVEDLERIVEVMAPGSGRIRLGATHGPHEDAPVDITSDGESGLAPEWANAYGG
jgi:ParB family chromosome partitioning protein